MTNKKSNLIFLSGRYNIYNIIKIENGGENGGTL